MMHSCGARLRWEKQEGSLRYRITREKIMAAKMAKAPQTTNPAQKINATKC
jgi:hypothetical protein